MTIKDFIIEKELKYFTQRLNRLKELEAPCAVIISQQRAVKELKDGVLKVSGDKELLDLEYISHEMKKGRGGKVYIVFNKHVNYFPEARYGRYIKEAQT